MSTGGKVFQPRHAVDAIEKSVADATMDAWTAALLATGDAGRETARIASPDVAMSSRATLPVLLVTTALGLAACSDKPPAPRAPADGKAAVATPWDGLKQDEQRARDVQKTVDRQADEQRRQIEAAEQ